MSDKIDHICVDTETLSTQSNAVIVTIAAVKFNFSTDDVETFCVNINPREGKALGLHISEETIDWWRKQKPEAIRAWQTSQIGLSDAIDQFTTFTGTSRDTVYWANGSWFDYPILESSYRAAGKDIQWKYWNVHDMRTAYYLAGLDTKKEPRIGMYHNAIDDCLTQIAWLKKALGKEV